MKKKYLFLASLLISCLIPAGYASFYLSAGHYEYSQDVSSSQDKQTRKVTFSYGGQILKTSYLKDNSFLSLKDAPLTSDSKVLEWKSSNVELNNGAVIIDSSKDLNFIGTPIVNKSLSGDTGSTNFTDKGYEGNFSANTKDKNGNSVTSIPTNSKNLIVNGDTSVTLDSAHNNQTSIVTLQNDVVMSNGKMIIGGVTGYYGGNTGWAQINAQGFITGNYSTLDLNGHDLILTKGFTLESFGLIRDSRKRRGKIIIKDGATLESPFVIQDVYREDSMPNTYFNNSSIFNMYYMPYLQADVEVEAGGQLKGKIRMSIAGSGNDAVETSFPIIGKDSDNSALIKLKKGKISRFFSEDDELKAKNNNFVNNNYIYHRYKYEAVGAEIELNEFNISISFSGLSLAFKSSKYQFFVPPYFEFKLIDSVFYLNQELIFLPGSSLYVDKGSKVILGGSEELKKTEALKNYFFGIDIPAQTYQNIGGLTFMDYEFDHKNAMKWLDTRKYNDGADGYGQDNVYFNQSSFLGYFNSKPAYCNLEGRIEFNEIKIQKHPYVLGGNININNLNIFKKNIQGKQIRFFGNSFTSGPNRLSATIFKSVKRLSMSEYINVPLISFGNVLTDISDPSKLYENPGQSFDSSTRLITSNNKKYGFFFNDESNDNLYKANNIDDNDSLDGTFKEVSYDISSHVASVGTNQYIMVQGAFIPKTSSGKYSIKKFQGENSSLIGSEQDFSYQDGIWKIK